MNDCVFCNILNRTIESEILFESDNVFVIKDIMPKAPVHLQVIAKEHISSVNDLTEANSDLISEMILTTKAQAVAHNIAEKGYKLVWNVGHDGGQVIPHIHIHVLGGKQLEE